MRTLHRPQVEVVDDHAARFCATHPVIIDNAPGWARRVVFTEVGDDGGARFQYEFEDDKFTILERWDVTPDGSLTYGGNNDDEPEISCKGNALLEMVADYIERTGK